MNVVSVVSNLACVDDVVFCVFHLVRFATFSSLICRFMSGLIILIDWQK